MLDAQELLAAFEAGGKPTAGVCKNMFLAHKKKPELMFLVVCRATLDTKVLWSLPGLAAYSLVLGHETGERACEAPWGREWKP